LLGDGEYIRRRWKDKGELCLTPAAILAAGTVKQFRRFGYSLDFIRPATSFLANLTLKDIELAAEHDLFLVAAADVEPQFVPQDHEIVQTPGRNPPAVVLWMRQGLPKLRAALERLDAVTNEEEL
jgi:hypothetical protein